MPTPPTPFVEIRRTVETWHACLDEGWDAAPKTGQPGAAHETTRRLGLSQRSSVERRLDIAAAVGVEVRAWRASTIQTWIAEQRRRYARDGDYQEFVSRPARGRPRRDGRGAAPPASAPAAAGAPPDLQDPAVLDADQASRQIIPLLRRGPLPVVEIAERLHIDIPTAYHAVLIARTKGAALYDRDGMFHLDPAPAMGSQRGDQPSLVSDENGFIRFGAVGDTHLGSKYAREDCLEDWYDQLSHWGIRTVLHAGNWIDGEAPFNRHDLFVHGMDAQMQYLAKHYPQRPGVETWAITGEDHEGWYSRREGIDVGRYAERVMQDNGRTDWRDMGFMECFVPLVHGATGASSKLCLMHPGGGSAYAVSYAPQKIVEGFDGGDKPAVLLIGHYHKASYNLIRNVHTVQVGCFEDQTVFMRKQKLSAHLGGFFCELKLDPETGAVVQFTNTLRNYFVRDYYKGRWSQHGPVNHAPRSPK